MDNNINKHANSPRSEVRRKDYAVTDPVWIKALLTQGAYGVLATAHEGQPYLAPVNYIYLESENALYFHGARVGRTRANIALNPEVCFNVSQMGRLIPDERSSEFGIEYDSVTVFGKAELVADPEVEMMALLGLMRKYFPDHVPGEDYPLPQPEETERTAVYKIIVEEWSAKRLTDEDDNPNAFTYPVPDLPDPERGVE